MFEARHDITLLQQEDLMMFGKLIVSLCCSSLTVMNNLPKAVETAGRHYSAEVKNILMYLLTKPHKVCVPRFSDSFMLKCYYLPEYSTPFRAHEGSNAPRARRFTEVSHCQLRLRMYVTPLRQGGGLLGEQLDERARERTACAPAVQIRVHRRASGVRTRPTVVRDRRPVYHQALPRLRVPPGRRARSANPQSVACVDGSQQGRMFYTSAHPKCTHTMAKLDAGVEERIMLVSRDEQSCLVVSYREIKSCIDSAFRCVLPPVFQFVILISSLGSLPWARPDKAPNSLLFRFLTRMKIARPRKRHGKSTIKIVLVPRLGLHPALGPIQSVGNPCPSIARRCPVDGWEHVAPTRSSHEGISLGAYHFFCLTDLI